MGYRLHFAKTYDPEWLGGYFNWNSEEFENLYYGEFSAHSSKEEESDIYELDRADITAYLKKLATLDPTAVNEYFTGVQHEEDYTNAAVAAVLQEILDGSQDTHIRIEWF